MKYSLLKYYITAFFLCSSFIILAQVDPGSGSNDNGIDNDGASDTNGLPIDDYLWVMILVALIVVFFKFRSMQSKAVNE